VRKKHKAMLRSGETEDSQKFGPEIAANEKCMPVALPANQAGGATVLGTYNEP